MRRASEQEAEFLEARLGLFGSCPQDAFDAHQFSGANIFTTVVDEGDVFDGSSEAVEYVAVDAAGGLADAVVSGEGEEVEEAPPFGAADCFCDGVRGVGEDADAYALVSQESDEGEGGFVCVGHT